MLAMPDTSSLSHRQQLHSLLSFCRDVRQRCGRRQMLITLLAITTAAMLDGVGLLMLLPVLNRLWDSKGSDRFSHWLDHLGLHVGLPGILALFMVLVLLRALAGAWRDRLGTRLRLEYVDHLRADIMSGMVKADWRFLTTRSQTDLLHLWSMDLARVNSGAYALLLAVANIALGCGQIVVALSLSLPLSLTALSCAALLWLTLGPQLRRAQSLGQRVNESSRQLFGGAQELLGGVKLVKAFCAEQRHLSALERLMADLRRAQLQFIANQALARGGYDIGAALLVIALLLAGHGMLHLPAGQLLLLLLVFARLMPLGNLLNNHLQNLLHAMPAFMATRHWCAECRLHEEAPATALPLPPFQQQLSLQGIGLRYPTRQHAALQDVSLTITAQTTTVIFGPSGAGKSTLGDIMLGLMQPEQGSLSVDGLRLTQEHLHAWRQQLAYVPQDAYMFPDSVRNNLHWAKPDASDAELWQALEHADAADFVRSLPDGIDTSVGERGVRISGGERQRLALARALLRQPRLLVLDEATSQLDVDSEARIINTLQRLHGSLTVVAIGHREAFKRIADQVVIIDKGRLQVEEPQAQRIN